MAESTNERSQDATPHRRQEAREHGQVAQSQDLGSATLLLGALVVLLLMGSGVVEYLAGFTRQQLGGDAWLSIDPGGVTKLFSDLASGIGGKLLPLMMVMLVIVLVVNVVQTGFLFLPEKAMPDWSRVNPFKGLGRIFSLANTVRIGFGLIKLLAVATVAGVSLYQRWEEILGLAMLDLPEIGMFVVDISLWTSIKIAGALFVLALFDYGFQWWKHEQDLKMTPQEVREELRNLQGDPQIIARRRAVQRQLVLNRLSSAIPKTDVVITNPTELAIAIQYEPETMAAPIVVAKGAGTLAARIRRLALENGVPIIEKKPLAQALYKEVDINRPIPDTLYGPVAEVLAYVYQLKGKPLPRGVIRALDNERGNATTTPHFHGECLFEN